MVSNAQIQNKILDFTLGTTTIEDIKEKYPKATGNWAGDIDRAIYPGSELHGNVTEGEPALNIKNIKFAGIDWEYVSCMFYRGKLCEFTFSSKDHPEYSTWIELCNALSNKYKKYQLASEEENGAKYLIFSDGTTRIIACFYNLYSEVDFFTLNYQHVSLFQKKFQKKIDPSEL